MQNKSSLMCKQSDCTIIRVWASGLNKTHLGENVGHVSIETPHNYMSLWPAGEIGGVIKQFFEHRPAHYMVKYNDDEAIEERPSEITICLYSLDTQKMEEKFDSEQKCIQGWTLLGGNVLINSNVESCASFAYQLLKDGGIYDLISQAYSSKYSSIVTPDALIMAIKSAKKQELKSYPETQSFNFPSETPLENKEVNPYSFWGNHKGKIVGASTAIVALGAAGLVYAENFPECKIV